MENDSFLPNRDTDPNKQIQNGEGISSRMRPESCILSLIPRKCNLRLNIKRYVRSIKKKKNYILQHNKVKRVGFFKEKKKKKKKKKKDPAVWRGRG